MYPTPALPTRVSRNPVDRPCDLCGKQAVADAPTKQGPWAYLCDAHYRSQASVGATFMGTRLTLAVAR